MMLGVCIWPDCIPPPLFTASVKHLPSDARASLSCCPSRFTAAAAAMIEVVLNDRLGKKASQLGVLIVLLLHCLHIDAELSRSTPQRLCRSG